MKMAVLLIGIILALAGCAPSPDIQIPNVAGEVYLTNPSGGAEKQAGMLVYLLTGDPLGSLDSVVSVARAHKDSVETTAIETVLNSMDSIRARQRQMEARYEKETQNLMLKFIKQYGGSTAQWPSDAFQQMLDQKQAAPMDESEFHIARLKKNITERVNLKAQQLKSEYEHHIAYLIMSAVIDSARTDTEGRFEILVPDSGEYHLFAERGNRAWYIPVKIEKKESQALALAPYNIGTHPLNRLEF